MANDPSAPPFDPAARPSLPTARPLADEKDISKELLGEGEVGTAVAADFRSRAPAARVPPDPVMVTKDLPVTRLVLAFIGINFAIFFLGVVVVYILHLIPSAQPIKIARWFSPVLLGIWFLVMGILQIVSGFVIRSELKK